MDLEILFLFPFSIILPDLDFFGYFITMLFIIILTLGFFYEWSKGALDWS
jgi:NADH-quinone oxidoreductase subunit A